MTAITQMTQQVIDALKQLATTSTTASANLQLLEAHFDKLASVKLNNFASWNAEFKAFSSALKQLGMDSETLKKVESNIEGLARSSKGMDFGQNFRKLSTQLKTSRTELSLALNEIKSLYKSYENIAGRGGGKDLFAQFTTPGKAASFAGTLAQTNPGQAQQLVADYTKLQTLLANVNRLQAQIKATEAAIVPYKKYSADVESNKEQERLAKEQRAADRAAGITRGRRYEMDTSESTTDDGGEQPASAWLQRLNLSSAATQKLSSHLEKLGVANGTVTNSYKDLNSGMTHANLITKDLNGNIGKATVVFDKAGNVVNTTSNRFRTFASGIARDIVEVAKWSIAIGAVYGPIRKLNELIEESKKIQADLVDVQIALGGSTADLQNIFEASIDIANETSSAVEGVVEGYTAAVAAAGSAANEGERLATTQILVRDSMVLSKLAGIDQKEALDTLVGALRQAGLELTGGMKLMDSWVAVSRNANVSINQLATTFAIVGAGAEEVGLSYSELNALAATMAETTKLSADEVGNAIRGIIATLQTDKASQEFAKYGIATKNLNGDLRDMMDILRELAILQQTGVLDEKAMGALTQAGGGGARRGAQLSALVNNMTRVMDIIDVSEGASGDATRALELKMSTLESAVQRLNNAFSGLAQSLGMEGGIIAGLTAATNLFTKVINGVKELVSILKWATPILAMAGIGKVLAGTQTGNRLLGANLPAAVANLLIPSAMSQLGTTTYTSEGPVTSRGMAGRGAVGKGAFGFGAPLTNQLLGRMQGTNLGIGQGGQVNTVGGLLGSMFGWAQKPFNMGRASMSPMNYAVPGMMIGSSLMQGNTGQAGAQAIGAGLGSALSAITGFAMWPMIGTIIATGFYDKFLTFEGDLAQGWLLSAEEAKAERDAAGGTPRPEDRNLEQEIEDSLSGWEKFQINFRETLASSVAGYYDFMSNFARSGSIAEIISAGTEKMTEQEATLSLFLGGNAFDEETQALLAEAFNEFIITSTREGLRETAIDVQRSSNIDAIAGIAATASEELMAKALEDISKGASGSIQNYLDYSQAASQYATSAGTYMTARQLVGMEDTTGAEAVDFVTNLDQGQRELLATISTQIVQGYNVMGQTAEQLSHLIPADVFEEVVDQIEAGVSGVEALTAGLTTSGTSMSEDDLEMWGKALEKVVLEVQGAARDFPTLIAALRQAASISEVEQNMPSFVSIPEDLTGEQRSELVQRAEALWREVLELSGASDDQINEYIDGQTDQFLKANAEIFKNMTSKAPQEYFNMAGEEMGLSGAGAGSQFGFQDLRDQYSMSSFMSQLMPRYQQVVGAFQRNFPQYDIQEEDTGFILEDGFAMQHVDASLLQLAMQDLIDLTREKGMEGIYNLPEGATFSIPLTGFQMDRATRNGMEGAGGGSYAEDIISQQTPGYATGVGPTDVAENLATMSIEDIREEVASFRRAGEDFSNIVRARATDRSLGEELLPQGTVPYPENITKPSEVPFQFLPQQQQPSEDESFWQPIFDLGTTIGNLGTDISTAINTGISNLLRSVFGIEPLPSMENSTETSQNASPAPVALNLTMDSTTQLVVDGRTLATIIKPYLYEDLLRFSASTPVVNRSVI